VAEPSSGIRVVVNPASAGGATSRRWASIAARLEAAIGPLDAEISERPGDITERVADALAGGCRRIIVVGGDGALGEAVNGFLRDGGPPPEAALAHIPSGTGSDFRRTIGAGRSVTAALETLRSGNIRRLDVGRVTVTDAEGTTRQHYFLNAATLGMSAAVVRTAERLSWLRRTNGTLAFYVSALANLAVHRNARIHLAVDDRLDRRLKVNTVAICNGQYAGGGMWLAPSAVPDDGLLDVVVMGDLGLGDSLRLTATLYRGRHLGHPEVTALRGHRITVESDEEVWVEADGEIVGRLPATVEIVPAAIDFLCPARF